MFSCAPDGVRTSGIWISSPTFYQWRLDLGLVRFTEVDNNRCEVDTHLRNSDLDNGKECADDIACPALR